jgi:hypothetical protein
MHVVIEARGDHEALQVAKKLEKLLKEPMVRMAIRDEGIQLAYDDGRPVVYSPAREGA